MSKHTLGLWEYAPHMKDHRIYATDRTKYHRTVTICLVANHPQQPNEFEANAHLIAAAPELLEVCKQILKFNGGHILVSLKDELKQAIAKAEGHNA